MNFIVFVLGLTQIAAGAVIFLVFFGVPTLLIAAVLFGSGSVTLAVAVTAIRLTEIRDRLALR